MNILVAARLLGGDVVGKNSIVCPGPGHSRHDRSLQVSFIGADVRVHSHAGDDWKACKDHVRGILGGVANIPAPIDDPDEDKRRTERALALWNAALPIAGTPAEAYLAGRGLSYRGLSLRWHPFCPFGRGVVLGCMVALVCNTVTNAPQAIHRTAIDQAGRKLSQHGSNGRMALGPVKGGAVKLMDPREGVLGIAEGIETALSLSALCQVPVWSVLNAAGIRAFPALPDIGSLYIAADNDRTCVGLEAARTAARRRSAPLETFITSTATVGTDLNDALREAISHA